MYDSRKFLQDLKIGDKVSFESRGFGPLTYTIKTVERVTGTWIIVDGKKYRRRDGQPIQRLAYTYGQDIVEYKPEHEVQNTKVNKAYELSRLFGDFDKVSVVKLVEMPDEQFQKVQEKAGELMQAIRGNENGTN
jgi:hypothetical protein